MLTTIVEFAIKVYVYGKIYDVAKDVGNRIKDKLSEHRKEGSTQIIETYFVD